MITEDTINAYLYGNKSLKTLHIESGFNMPYFKFCKLFNEKLTELYKLKK